MHYLICGNWGSSDEGRDGGLCNHTVGGDAVRRGVEPEKRWRWSRGQVSQTGMGLREERSGKRGG